MKYLLMALTFSTGLFVGAAQAATGVQGMELSLWGQNLRSHGGQSDIPFAFDQNTSQVIRGELGDGRAHGIDFRLNYADDWFAMIGYSDSKISPDNRVFDSNPAATNNCNVRPVQGLVSDCFDNAHYRSSTKTTTFDAAFGKRFAWGNVNIEPLFGARYFKYSQNIHVDYLFPGGFEDFIDRNNTVSGWGPLLGLQFSMPLGQNGFFLRGGVTLASMNFGGTRQEHVRDFRTVNSAPLLTREATEDREVNPYTVDGSLMLGYNVTQKVALGLGYRYSNVTGVVDTRDSNTPAAGTIAGARGIGDPVADLRTSGWFAKLSFQFQGAGIFTK